MKQYGCNPYGHRDKTTSCQGLRLYSFVDSNYVSCMVVGWLFWVNGPFNSMSVYIGREKEKRKDKE